MFLMTNFTRHFFNFSLGIVFLILTGSSLFSQEKRPNIFFFFADDWGQYASCYSENPINQTFSTPSMDRVAREGVCFRNAHVSAPSCTPCRSALFSGQYFYRTGEGANLWTQHWDASIPTFPLLLEDAGYYFGFTYKGWGPGDPANAPLGGKRNAFNRCGGRFNQFSQNVTLLAAQGKSLEDAKEEIYQECLGNFDDFLARRKPGQPFCYYFGPTNTHRMWVQGSGKALWNLNPDDLKGRLPKFLPDVAEVREDFCDYLGEALALDAMMGRFLDILEKMGELENTIIIVSGDHGIPGFPRGKTNLYALGTKVPLLIRWGNEVPGNRRLDDFVNLMDLAPTILEAAHAEVPECMTGRSLIPVLKSESSGLADSTRDFVVTGRERHFVTAREGNKPYPSRAYRTKDWLYIRNYRPERLPEGDDLGENDAKNGSRSSVSDSYGRPFADLDGGPTKQWLLAHRTEARWSREMDWAFGRRPSEELYDLRTDPDALINLADDPKYQAVKKNLSQKLLKIQQETKDPRIEPNGGIFEQEDFLQRTSH